MSNNVVLFGTDPDTGARYALQCDDTGVLATSANVTIASNVDTKTILYSDLTTGAEKKVAIETLGIAPNQKDYLGTSDYAINQSFDATSKRIGVVTEGVRGLSDVAPTNLIGVNVNQTATNKNALYVRDDTLNTKITSDSSITSAIQVAVKNVVPISGSDYATPIPAYNPLFVDANGFITSNVVTTTHENIRLGYDYYESLLTFDSNIANSVFIVPSSTTNSLIPALNNDGWLFKNPTPTNPTKGSLMWYNNGPYGPTHPFATQTDILINQLDVFYVIIQNYYPASQSNIQMNVYTKPTGAIDDYEPGVFRSKFNYILDLSPAQYLATGQSYMLYHGQVNKIKLNDPEVPRIKYDDNIPGRLGPCDNTETVGHIELLFTDLVGGTQFLCNIVEGGIFSSNGHLVNYYFDNDIRTKTDTVISQLTVANNSLKTNITNDGINSAAIAQNTITPVVNLKDTYGLVTDSVLYAKNPSGDIKMLTQDASGNLNVNLATGTVSSDGKAYLYNGAGNTPITQTTISSKNGIDSNIINASLTTNIRGNNGEGTSTYNDVVVDANGVITVNPLEKVYQNIYLSFQTYSTDLCAGSSNLSIWSKNNVHASSQDGWCVRSEPLSNNISLVTYFNNTQGDQYYYQTNFTYANIDTWYSIFQNWNPKSTSTMPIIRVYSTASRWDYTFVAGQPLNVGESIMLYFGLTSRIKYNNVDCRRVQYSLTGGTGPRIVTEVINQIEMYLPISVNEYIDWVVVEGAVFVNDKGLINNYFTNDKNGRVQDDINGIKVKTDLLNFDGSARLNVDSTLSLNNDVTHFTAPISSGINSTNGFMANYIGGAVEQYNLFTGKIPNGYINPINTVQIDYDSTSGTYRQALCVNDTDTRSIINTAFNSAGGLVAGVNGSGVRKRLLTDDSGRLDVNIVNTPATTIKGSTGSSIGSTTDNYTKIGLNVYQITPKTKTFNLNSYNGSGGVAGSMITGFFNNSALLNFQSFGAGLPNTRAYYFKASGSTIPGNVSWVAVDGSGNEITGTTNVNNLTSYFQIGSVNFVSVNSFNVINNKYPSQVSDQLNITISNTTVAPSLGGVNSAFTANGIYTCPNGCIAKLNSFSGFCSATETFFIMKNSANGSRNTLFRFENVTTITGYSGNTDGYIYLTPGESVYFARSGITGNSFLYGGITQVTT